MEGSNARGERARRRILEAVVSDPGITRSELQRCTSLAWGTIGHHLRKLSAQGAVDIIRIGRNLHVLPSFYAERLPHDSLASPLARRVVQGLKALRTAGPTQLGRVAGTTPRRVHAQIECLLHAGLVKADGGYHPRYQLTPRGVEAADELEACRPPIEPPRDEGEAP